MIRHVVLFKARKDATPAEIDAVYAALRDLKRTVPGITAFSIGRNVSPEGLGRGYDHGFVVDFTDAAARDGYLPHPEHQKAAAALVAICEGGVEGIVVSDHEG
jgi:hypothetical protein